MHAVQVVIQLSILQDTVCTLALKEIKLMFSCS